MPSFAPFFRHATLLILAAIAASGGCTGRPDWRRVDLEAQAMGSSTGSPWVEIENARGVVTVTIDPRIKDPEVIGNVYAASGLTKPIREQVVTSATFAAEWVEGPDGPVVKVNASPAPGTLDMATVEIEVRLASCSGVSVKNAGGAVRLIGVAGPVTVENGVDGPGGMVIVRTGIDLTDAVTLTTTSGDIYLQVPINSTGRMDLKSLNGEAELRAQGGRLSEVNPTHTWYQGVLNGGTNPVTLRSGAGKVRVTVLDHAGTHVPAE